MIEGSPISVLGVNHFFGEGPLRKQILFDVNAELRSGEIVIVTGPSGSGKTTLLTLIGALRSVQEGDLQVLGRELRGAGTGILNQVRRQIGYVFQSHNLLNSLTAGQNVQMGLLLHGGSRRELKRRTSEMLAAVGLGDQVDSPPRKLSGGQLQRVAIARALVSRPRMVLADEPTASLDRKAGRDVVEIMEKLAREQGATVLLVTHDNRILDVADRILHLEDGRLSPFTETVISNTRQMMAMLAQNNRRGELGRRVAHMPVGQFLALLEQITRESRQFLEAIHLSENEAFQSMLEQVLEAFTFKLGAIVGAERASIFLVDRERGELWLRVAQEENGKPVQTRIPIETGLAGYVARTGESIRIDDAYSHPMFNPEVDRMTGFVTRGMVSLPIRDRTGQVFAVAQLLNRVDGEPFDAADERRFGEFVDSIGVILESWWRMNRAEQAQTPVQT